MVTRLQTPGDEMPDYSIRFAAAPRWPAVGQTWLFFPASRVCVIRCIRGKRSFQRIERVVRYPTNSSMCRSSLRMSPLYFLIRSPSFAHERAINSFSHYTIVSGRTTLYYPGRWEMQPKTCNTWKTGWESQGCSIPKAYSPNVHV